MLSKREAKYREKFIQLFHYTKEEQRIFDMAISSGKLSYYSVYEEVQKGAWYSWMAEIAVTRAALAARKAALSLEEVSAAAMAMSDAAAKIAFAFDT